MSFAEDESFRNSFGISYEFRNLFRRTNSLLSAARQGDTKNLEIYLRHGAYIESRDRLGYSILSLAASSGHIEAVRMLLDKGAAISEIGRASCRERVSSPV